MVRVRAEGLRLQAWLARPKWRSSATVKKISSSRMSILISFSCFAAKAEPGRRNVPRCIPTRERGNYEY